MTTTLEQQTTNRDSSDGKQLLNELAATTGQPNTRRRMQLAYLTTEYPKASHTFVRRELRALEDLGHDILRVSVRGCDAVVDPADLEEAQQTKILLGSDKLPLIMGFLKMLVFSPRKLARATRMTIAMWSCSNRNWIRHLAYLVEATKFYQLTKKHGIEHVHVHFGKNAADVARLAKSMGGPTYSMTIHGPGEFDAPVGYSLGAKVEDSEFTAAISHYGTAQLRRWVHHQHWNKLNVIRCTINDEFLSQRQPLETDTNQFVCIGRLTPQKGQLLLVEAVAMLVEQGVDVRLVLAGDGEIRDVLEQRIRTLGIQEQITITGWIGEADVRRHLLESRAMVLPSFAEGLPVAIMESLALGRPVISTCITGIPELLKDGANGWMITAGCVEDIARAMKEAVETPLSRINEMGVTGNARVVEQHLAETEAAKLEALLLEHVGTKK